MLIRLIELFFLAVAAGWIVLALRGDPALRVDPAVRRIAGRNVPLKKAMAHRRSIAKLVKSGATDAAGLVEDADKILRAMAELVERKQLLVGILQDSESIEAADELERIDASLERSEARLRAALGHLIADRTEDVRADLADCGEELEAELTARREIRAVERGT